MRLWPILPPDFEVFLVLRGGGREKPVKKDIDFGQNSTEDVKNV